ncbi:MAG: hypothetical protein NZ961_09265, partial [Candidatus Poribacteria bacterium]|nr:hypothetical protein [Candidatus Poribacteria bacterium]
IQVFVDSLSLVEGKRVTKLVAELTPNTEGGSTSTASTRILASNNEVAISEGTLAGLIEARDQHLPSMLTRMKTLSETLIAQVNKIHKSGYGLDKSTGPTGLEFFSGTSIDDITVNSQLLADPKKLGVSSALGAPGNNEIALEIAQLQTSLTIGATVIPNDRQILTVEPEGTTGWAKGDILGVKGNNSTFGRVLTVDSGTQVTIELFQNPTTKTFDKQFDFVQEDGSITVITDKVYEDADGNYYTTDPNQADDDDLAQMVLNGELVELNPGPETSSVMTANPVAITSGETFTEGTQTFSDYFASMYSFIGTQSQQAQRNSENTELLVQQLTDYREKVSGVSLDEEMANLIQFQRAFEASARYIRIVDEMLATLMNM